MRRLPFPTPPAELLGSPSAVLSASLEADDEGGCAVRLGGEIDLATADTVISIGRYCLGQPAVDRLIIDLAEVTFVDASGLGALVSVHDIAHEWGKRVGLDRVPARVDRLLRLTGLAALFDDELSSNPSRRSSMPAPATSLDRCAESRAGVPTGLASLSSATRPRDRGDTGVSSPTERDRRLHLGGGR